MPVGQDYSPQERVFVVRRQAGQRPVHDPGDVLVCHLQVQGSAARVLSGFAAMVPNLARNEPSTGTAITKLWASW
jgi:hypothetical protein